MYYFVSFQTSISSHRHERAFKWAFYTKHCSNDDKNSILEHLNGPEMHHNELSVAPVTETLNGVVSCNKPAVNPFTK